MTALAAPRSIQQIQEHALIDIGNAPVKASTKIYSGGIVVSDAGYAAPARVALGLIVLGIARQDVDNTGGASGDKTVEYLRGAFPFINSAGGDAIAQADLGKDVYLVDDQTVAKTDGGGTRSKAGRFVGFDDAGVKPVVELGGVGGGSAAGGSGGYPVGELVYPVTFADLANGNFLTLPPMKFAGRIRSAYVAVEKAVTSAAKLATLTPKIGGVAVTGAALALTSANLTPQGASVSADASALNTFNVSDVITVDASAVTTFIEGSGSLHLVLG